MKSKKILATLVAAMLATGVLAGCGSKTPDTTTPGTQPAATDSIDKDQTLHIVGYDYTSLDTAAVSDAESMTTFGNVFEGLTREVTKDGKVTTELAQAKEIKANTDGTVYTITLRDGIQWSDGKPVTAKDFEFGWKRLTDPSISVDYLAFLGDELGVKGAAEFAAGKGKKEDVGVKALDDKTLEVTLTHPNPYFESALAFKLLAPQREDIVTAAGKDYGTDYTKVVYNGPFVISEYTKGSKIVYTKNEKYWDAANVKLQKAECPIIDEPTTLVQMFENKELDQTGATGDNIAKLDAGKDAGGYDHITGQTSSVFYFVFNAKNQFLKNKNVRLALATSYDRQELLDVVYKRFFVANGIVPTKIMLGNDEYRNQVPEPLKAVTADPKATLETGLKELGTTADKVKLTILMGPTTSTGKALTEYITKQWKDKLGITVDVKFSVDGPSYFKDRNQHNFDIVAGGWGADYNDVASYFVPFTTGNGNNGGEWSNAEYDKLVKQAGSELDPAKRVELYKQAEQILIGTDAAVSPNYYQDVHSFRYKYVKGMYLPMFGGYYDLKNVYIQGKE